MRGFLLAAGLAGLGGLLGTGGPAAAQSFDCTRATHQAEVAVCEHATLGDLDEEASRLYYSYPKRVRTGPDMSAEQRRFVRERNACGYQTGCIEAAYYRFIDYLRNH